MLWIIVFLFLPIKSDSLINLSFTKTAKMAKNRLVVFQFMAALFAVVCSSTLCSAGNNGDRKVHIVYMGSIRNRAMTQSSHHLNLLQLVAGAETDHLYVRSYKKSFNGFAAHLTDSEREKLAAMEGVISVFPSKELKTQTTRSWDFVGLSQTSKRDLTSESDVIIGSFDTGIWPESESFNDVGLGPPPKRWKGACAGGANFTCNNKIIGARYYSFASSPSARDNTGHGTHTASTAAGKPVVNVSLYGLATGVARGAVPSARIAAYKVCDPRCHEVDVLAAFDDAIADGVDLITLSLGDSDAGTPFKYDAIAIGSFHAMARGILTVHSAGNQGPREGTVASLAPWLFSVAATTTDRSIVDKVILGNGKTVVGYSLNTFPPNENLLPLIYAKNAGKNASAGGCRKFESELCRPGCLDPELVKGKIVQCMSYDGASEAQRAGAEGAIVLSNHYVNVSLIVPFPTSALNLDDYIEVGKYTTTATNPTARILKSEAIQDASAPKSALFSGRGPNRLMPEIMKPDISAPGVEILAAFSHTASPSELDGDKRLLVKYAIMSGTSMSCPHVAGVAAYVKSFHQDWSPSAIKSAIMTTAKYIVSDDKFNIGEFIYGSGEINPEQAVEPGLVYETSKEDYINLLCGNGYDSKSIKLISGDNSSTCSTNVTTFPPKDLNYPAMVAQVLPLQPFVVKFQRTVTNVGSANSTYNSEFLPFSKVYVLQSPENLNTSVEPRALSFEALNEKKSFTVTVTGGMVPAGTVYSTALVWSDGIHKVRSPIVVKVISQSSPPPTPN